MPKEDVAESEGCESFEKLSGESDEELENLESSNLTELGIKKAKAQDIGNKQKSQKPTRQAPTNPRIQSNRRFSINNNPNNPNRQNNKIGHEELYSIITGDEISWQTIIHELVRTEQLDPLDIDLILLTRSFLEKVQHLEEANFFVSGKMLLAAAILLRMKSERIYEQLLLFDELLFGRKEEPEEEQPKFFIPFEGVPLLLPKTPLPRLKRVTMEELMQSLERAIEVEERRQRRFEAFIQAEREAAIALPVAHINIQEKIREIYKKIREYLTKQLGQKLTFSQLVGSERREDKIATFIPLLHLDSRERITLEQLEHFGEIYIYLFKKESELNL